MRHSVCLEDYPSQCNVFETQALIQYTPSFPPYFDPLLPEAEEIECSALAAGDRWSLQVPDIIDPNESAVELAVDFDTNFFSFNSDTQVIK